MFHTKTVAENTKDNKALLYPRHEDVVVKIGIIGSGWLAQPLAWQLQKKGHIVMLTTTNSAKLAELKVNGLNAMPYSLGDQLADPNLLFDVDVLIIAITSKNIDSYDVLIDQLKEQKCQHVIYISATSVYQNDGTQHDEESLRLNLSHPLLKIENIIKTHLSASIIRFAGLIGPKRHPGYFFNNGKLLKNPDAPVNLIHLDDCIGLINAVIDNDAWGQTFNGCADTHPSKIEYYSAMSKQINQVTPTIETNGEGDFKLVDNTKAKSVLNYKFIHPDLIKIGCTYFKA
ncbi:MAG: NAD(P)-binding domain-containing protein [Marinicella sp.]